MQPVPVGVVGELYIGGDGVALGYLNRPELTAERFLADPFRPGSRLYRTGDLARWRSDGNLEFLGRNDHQVKVRGFRIELGEIESVLCRHPAVKEAVTLARELRAGDVRLVAYVVPRSGQVITSTELRRHLRGSLPEYMVPQHVIELEKLPLSPSGKVDRRALSAPFATPAPEAAVEPPRSESEQLLAKIWTAALGTSRVGLRDNFFDLGGHSLLCLEVIAQIEKRTGRRLSPRVLLLNSLEQVAAQLAAEPALGAEPKTSAKSSWLGRLLGQRGN
jgi:hypothetical protein